MLEETELPMTCRMGYIIRECDLLDESAHCLRVRFPRRERYTFGEFRTAPSFEFWASKNDSRIIDVIRN
ncbi:MAG: hypothetical protein WC242_01715 [Candidatus Paceibacterota bacterium]